MDKEYIIEYRCNSKNKLLTSFDWKLLSSYKSEQDRDFAFDRVYTHGPSFYKFYEFRKGIK